jgi:hypothetical protein
MKKNETKKSHATLPLSTLQWLKIVSSTVNIRIKIQFCQIFECCHVIDKTYFKIPEDLIMFFPGRTLFKWIVGCQWDSCVAVLQLGGQWGSWVVVEPLCGSGTVEHYRISWWDSWVSMGQIDGRTVKQ